MAATVSRDEPDSLSEKLHREMETLGGGFVHRLRSASCRPRVCCRHCPGQAAQRIGRPETLAL